MGVDQGAFKRADSRALLRLKESILCTKDHVARVRLDAVVRRKLAERDIAEHHARGAQFEGRSMGSEDPPLPSYLPKHIPLPKSQPALTKTSEERVTSSQRSLQRVPDEMSMQELLRKSEAADRWEDDVCKVILGFLPSEHRIALAIVSRQWCRVHGRMLSKTKRLGRRNGPNPNANGVHFSRDTPSGTRTQTPASAASPPMSRGTPSTETGQAIHRTTQLQDGIFLDPGVSSITPDRLATPLGSKHTTTAADRLATPLSAPGSSKQMTGTASAWMGKSKALQRSGEKASSTTSLRGTAARRRRPNGDPFAEFLIENSGKDEHQRRFSNQAKTLAQDDRLLEVYKAALYYRSLEMYDKEKAMDDKRLFDNSYLYHENNVRQARAKCPLKLDGWEGPQDVRELIQDVNEGRQPRRLALQEVVRSRSLVQRVATETKKLRAAHSEGTLRQK